MIDPREISRFYREIKEGDVFLYLDDQNINARMAGIFYIRMRKNYYMWQLKRGKLL